MEKQSNKQRNYKIDNIQFSSDFQSGNLSAVELKEPNTYHLWVEADPNSTYKTWFYFSVKGVPLGATLTFCIINLSNQVKLFKEGHLPVFRSQEQQKWSRIKIPLQQNGVARGDEGFQLTFKHNFTSKSKHFFAFSYPWTHFDSNMFIRDMIQHNKEKYFCDYRKLCLTSKKHELSILTVTKIKQKNSLQIIDIQGIQDVSLYSFTNKKGIFVSARVHPGQVASSHILNGFIKFLFSRTNQSQMLLQNFVFYIIPMVNPDGVIEGNFRTDSLGKNLNRYYTDPSQIHQPEIYSIKRFLLQFIGAKLIQFCLDLHAHVNKQGAFVYGNSTPSLKEQMAVCMFPKLLQYNCRFFDYEACNFSQKNMASKDKGDELSKEGASRVAIYKETGLVSCWTLQCNYNSSRFANVLPKAVSEEPHSRSLSNGIILEVNGPARKEELTFLNIQQFQQIGANIAVTLLDYYKVRKIANYFGSKLKNSLNFQLNLATNILRIIPFKFDNDCRKIINAINSGQCLNQNFGKIIQKIGLDPINQYLSIRKQQSNSKQKDNNRIQSLKSINSLKVTSTQAVVDRPANKSTSLKITPKQDIKANKLVIIIPNIPKVPRKK